MITLNWNGYCPESKIYGLQEEMRLNNNDLWESELTGLQIAVPYPGIQAVIMKTRGKGIFRKKTEYASGIALGELLSQQTSDSFPYCDKPFNKIQHLKEFIQEIEPLNETIESQLTRLSALDIVNQYFEVYQWLGRPLNWTKKGIETNEYAFLCYKKLISLCKAFKLGDCKKIEDGRFILSRPIEDYVQVFSKINDDYAKWEMKKLNKTRSFDYSVIKYSFTKLWGFRGVITNLFNYGSFVFEASREHSYPLLKMNLIKRDIEKNVPEIDEILSMIISPENKKITKFELIKYYNFPDYEIDVFDTL